MKSTIDTRLSRLEARQPRKGRHYRFIVRGGEYDPDEELRKRGIVLGPDDGVTWIEIVAVTPPDRPPGNEGAPTERHGANDEVEP